MKPTAYLLVGSVAAWISLLSAHTSLAADAGANGPAAVAAGANPGGTVDPTAARAQSERLLRQAREAINRSDWPQAERLIAQAEAVAPPTDPLYERLVDTPAKVRKRLAEAKSAQASGGARPSERFVPSAGGVGSAAKAGPPSGPRGIVDPQAQLDLMTNDAASKARGFLDKGRLALQQNDVAGAVGWLHKTLATGARFTPTEYGPENLMQELRRAGVPDAQLVFRGPAPGQYAALRPDDFAEPANRAGANLPYAVNPAGATGEPRRLPPAGDPTAGRKAEALRLVAQSRMALDRGDAPTAKRLAEQAQALRVPDEAFGPNEMRPELLLLEVNSALGRQPAQAGNAYPVVPAYDPGNSGGDRFPVRQGIYDPQRDQSRNTLAQASNLAAGAAGNQDNLPPPAARLGMPQGVSENAAQAPPAYELFRKGLAALEQQDHRAASEFFNEAWKRNAELDPATRQTLRDKMTLLQYATPRSAPQANPLQEVASQQQIISQQLFRELSREQTAAEKMLESDPRGALERLQTLRQRIEQENLDAGARRQYLTLVDQSIKKTERYIDLHRADLESKERNKLASDAIDQRRQDKQENQQKVAGLVEKFNDLIEQRRFAEAEVLAKQASELDPKSEVVRSMLLTSKMGWRVQEQESIKDQKERGFYDALTNVERTAVPFDDRNPMVFDTSRRWSDLTRTRGDMLKRERSRMTPAELDIQKALKTQVEVRFENQSLSQVIDALGRMAGINVFLDPEGLRAEGITTEERVNINLSQPISLQSALKLILEPKRLGYVIQNEVLRITSEQTGKSDVYSKVYNVADLVIPIPNFIPSYNIGMPGAIREAYNGAAQGRLMAPVSKSTALTLASSDASNEAMTSASVLAQMNSAGMLPSVTPRTPQATPGGQSYVPSNMGGAAMADFDTLIDLITQTIAPQTWNTVGGPGSVERFPTNLSLVISQTQEVHEQIADLLEQLRRLQDLQVTIEVRYITLNDSFYEKIGVNFNFQINDHTSQVANTTSTWLDKGPTTMYGLSPDGQPTPDFDYVFANGPTPSAASIGVNPPFGKFDASTAANFGFAILSDIEVYFLLQAAEGDNRTNVLQAPKVTLFNGQTGFVSDTSQRPFVMSVVPVVGDFAAAHQPVVMVLNEGTSLSVQAVVSPDRRFVRLTMIPFFSSIGDVSTFTFSGRTTSNTGTTSVDPTDAKKNVVNNASNITEGTTVQLPTFNFTTVSTTVSVPDGGTVLLGGIKRLSEGRSERGVPMLSKIPYLNRLFKNVGIGREAQSLMMMVTPRIIIQEEEEFQQTGYDSAQP